MPPCWRAVLFCLLSIVVHVIKATEDISAHPLGYGHLKKFGAGGPRLTIDSVQLFMHPRDFFERYAKKSQPLIMKEAVKRTRACQLWTDDYFMKLGNVPAAHTVLVETKKKENRTQPSIRMTFKDFVTVYNTSDYYMVEPVPEFLRNDVALPGPLQCQDIIDGHLVENIMWFSGGGTKSVVHTDSVDNIICLYSGDKEFVLVDPHRFGAAADLDHPEGSYSSVDVDRVDYDRFPGFANVEFHVANLSAGDCLFIPYKWIHQVNSYGRNIAVNVWWDFHRNTQINLSECNDDFDANLTLQDIEFQGFSNLETSLAGIRGNLEDAIRYSRTPVDIYQLRKIALGPLGDPDFAKKVGAAHNIYVEKLFSTLDKDGDGFLSVDDFLQCSDEDWIIVRKNFNYLSAIINRVMDSTSNPYEDNGRSLPEHEEL